MESINSSENKLNNKYIYIYITFLDIFQMQPKCTVYHLIFIFSILWNSSQKNWSSLQICTQISFLVYIYKIVIMKKK